MKGMTDDIGIKMKHRTEKKSEPHDDRKINTRVPCPTAHDGRVREARIIELKCRGRKTRCGKVLGGISVDGSVTEPSRCCIFHQGDVQGFLQVADDAGNRVLHSRGRGMGYHVYGSSGAN